jgi:hypothetical protein
MRYEVFRGFKLPAALDAEIRRRARADERTVSAFLRRLIAGALAEHQDELGDGK